MWSKNMPSINKPSSISFKTNWYLGKVQWRAIQTALLPVYDVKWGHFERAKMTLKMLPASWYLKYLFKGFRSFNTVNMGSVGQRASKLLAVKVGGLKKKSAIWPRPLSNQSAQVRLRPGSNLSQSLTDSNFAALWPTDPIFTASIDLNPLKKCAKSQGCAVYFWVLYGSLKYP